MRLALRVNQVDANDGAGTARFAHPHFRRIHGLGVREVEPLDPAIGGCGRPGLVIVAIRFDVGRAGRLVGCEPFVFLGVVIGGRGGGRYRPLPVRIVLDGFLLERPVGRGQFGRRVRDSGGVRGRTGGRRLRRASRLR